MSGTHSLLTLPPEIRDHIWHFAFGDIHITPFDSAYDLSSCCVACQSLATREIYIVPHATAVAPLLTCKQIYNEARLTLYRTLTVHISSHAEMSKIGMTGNRSPMLHEQIEKLTLYTHLDAESRMHWFAELFALSITFPGLRQLRIHCHMRPPRDYDSLLDGTYLLGPLILLPSCIRPSARRAQLRPPEADGSSENSSSQQQQQQQQSSQPTTSAMPNQQSESSSTQSQPQPQPLYASRDLNPNFMINFSYSVSEVLFDSPFLGTISTADALEEHDAVLRDCLASSEFRHMAEQRDLQSMTMVLFGIAREHEQVWIEGLRRRRMGSEFIETEILGEIDGAVGPDDYQHDEYDGGDHSDHSDDDDDGFIHEEGGSPTTHAL